jgi:hypothetical protein
MSNSTTHTAPVIESVKSGSEFWADGGVDRSTSSEFSLNMLSGATTNHTNTVEEDDDDNDSNGTETGRDDDNEDIDEVGAQDAFVAGMIYALSRKMVPGDPYTPPRLNGHAVNPVPFNTNEIDRGRWRLEECLKWAVPLFPIGAIADHVLL